MESADSVHETPQGSFARPIRANGFRRVTLDMRAWLDQADSFKGLPAGTAKPLEFLYAFKEAEPYLGLPAHTYKLVDWLVRFTKPQDWEEGSRPIAWPEARRQEEFLGLSTRQTQALNRALQEAGIFVMRDDPQGRRYGHRDPKTGRITKAFGFDLSLLMERHEDFKKVAAEAQIECNRMKKLRQQKRLARRAIGQAAEELAVQGHDSEELRRLLQETDELDEAGSKCRRSNELALAVEALQRRANEVQQLLRGLIKPVETAPMGAENSTHSTSTTLEDNDLNHTVIASEACSPPEAPPSNPAPFPEGKASRSPSSRDGNPFPERLNVTPATLVELAPRLAPYMQTRTDDKSWPALIEAARHLTADLGISLTLWYHACRIMGDEYAAVAVAIVSTKPPGHFTKSAGGYFGGMVKKFEKDPASLCLGKTLWRLKEQTWGKDSMKERQAEEAAQRGRMATRSRAFPASRPCPPTVQAAPPASPMLPEPAPQPGLASATPIVTPQARRSSGGGFRQIGTVIPPRAVTPMPPVDHALMTAPVGSTEVSFEKPKYWRASPALLEEIQQVGRRICQNLQHHEDGSKSVLAEPNDGTASPAMPPDGDNE